MDEKQLSVIITREVDRALRADSKKGETGPFKVLGILTHNGKGLEQLFESLLQLSRERIPVLIWTLEEIDYSLQMSAKSLSFSTLKVKIGNKDSFVMKDYTSLEYIIYGAFSFEMADKLIHLKDEDPIANVLIQGLIHKIPVYILTPFPLADLVSEYKPLSKINQELRDKLSLLAKVGFGVLDENDLKERFLKEQPGTPDLITESFIENLRGKTQEIRVPRTAIITPLAREKARDLAIRIVRI
jgi:hypothetical protein